MRPEIPEWVWTWSWARRKGAVRPFPQMAPALTHEERKAVLSDEEYEHLRERWLAAGSPRSLAPIV